MAWPIVAAAGIAAASGLMGNLMENEQNRQAANTAWERSREAAATQWDREYGAYQSRYQTTAEDMRAAGLNPILAASGGFNVGGSGPSASAPQVHLQNQPNANLASSAKSVGEMFKASAEQRKIKQEIDYLEKKADESLANAKNIRAQTGLVTAQENLTIQKVWNAKQEFNKITQEAYKVSQDRDLSEAETIRVRTATKRLTYELEQLKKHADVYAGPAGAIITYVREVMDALNLGGGVFFGRTGGKR